MVKPEGGDAGRRKQGRRRADDLPSAVEGQIGELCRELSVQAKRMRQLHEQADELRVSFGEWIVTSNPPAD